MNKSRKFVRLLVLSTAMLCAVSCGEPTGTSSGGQQSTSIDIRTKYTVSFNACGGSSVASQQIIEGGTIQSAPSTTRANYSFSGWCRGYDQAARMGKEGTEVTFPFTVNENTVLYARWIKASGGSHTEEEVKAYVEGLKESSVKDHLYFHYYRFDNSPSSYSDWDIWCWPYRPKEGEGTRFDWVGRTTSADKLSAKGDAIIDEFGGAVADIDLTKTYDGGATQGGKKIGGTEVDYYQKDGKTLDTQIGIQVVKSSSRTKPEGKFWTNDGGDLHIDLEDDAQVMKITTKDGGTAFHVFSLQDKVASYQSQVINDMSDPFDGDDGKNVTRGKSLYNDVDWKTFAPKQATSPLFKNGIGVGYQIQVATFADSDGDGFGDIYGITQKLPYLAKLGVKALWLTPVQKSDSYHGYDISDYEAVDEKFGSTESPAGKAAGRVTPATAMEDYEQLIKEAHAKGMKIVMDLVLNHTSTSNKWFIKSAQLDPTHRGYYQWGNHKTDSGVTEAKCWFPYGDHDYSYYAKFGSSMPELNYQYKATRDAVNQMSVNWVKKGVDGFRLDAVKHIFMRDEVKTDKGDVIVEDVAAKGDYSSNLTKNLHFYRELNQAVKAVNKDAFFVGENFDGNAFNVSPFYEAFDSMFDFWGYFNFTTAASRAIGHYDGAGRSWPTIFSETSSQKEAYSGKTYQWNLGSILQSYKDLRGDAALPGFFTSNHDIARVINRIHSSAGDANGISEQGNVTTSDYLRFRRGADLCKAIEILMPGCTWIYYGDEIGMTGNFPSGKDSKSDYADLWWRQPMKWKQGAKVGDGSMTTGFSITGSAASIVWDEVNKTSTVVDATTQMNDANSEYSKLAKIIAYKNNNPALITGSVSDAGSSVNVMKFKNGSITITVDFTSSRVTAVGGTGALDVTF